MSKKCIDLDIPEHLHRNEKENDDNFLSDEIIYRRFEIKYKEDCEFLTSNKFNFPDKKLGDIFETTEMSVVREKFCKNVEDALYNINSNEHFKDWGVVALKVRDVKSKIFNLDDNRQFTLDFKHMPEDCWYPHSVIKVYENGVELNEIKPKSIKLQIKQFYKENCTFVKTPDICLDITS